MKRFIIFFSCWIYLDKWRKRKRMGSGLNLGIDIWMKTKMCSSIMRGMTWSGTKIKNRYEKFALFYSNLYEDTVELIYK